MSFPPARPQIPAQEIQRRLAAWNLERAWWMLVITTALTLAITGLAWVVGHPRSLELAFVADITGSALFLLLLGLARAGRLSVPLAGRLPAWYAVFFLLVCDLWYFTALPVFGDTVAHAVGVLVPAMFLILRPAFYLSLLAVNYATFVALLLLFNPVPREGLPALVSATVALVIAAAANILKHRAKAAEWMGELLIERQNQILEASNRSIQARSEELDELVAIAAHDLRAPLLSIASLCRMQKQEPGWQDGKHIEFLEAIEESATNMAGRVSQIIHAHRAGGVAAPPPDLQPLDLREIAGRVVKGAAQRAAEKGLAIEMVGPAAPAPAIGDPESTSRILENLLSNALKFCPPGAKIEIETGPGWAEVRDNGPGIPESERPNLFKKFRRGANHPTAGEDSSGLGLYIARSLALRMSGTLEFAPSASGGSAFRLTLPLT